MTQLAKIEDSEPTGLLAVIERAARDPSVDIDKMERLFAMQERLLAREAERVFNDAMAKAQAEIKPIVKNKYNEQTRSKYADLAAAADAIDPIAHKYGFSLSFGTAECPMEGHHRITCKVANGEHSEMRFADVPADTVGMKGTANKTATHGFGSTMSYGRRYLKLLIFDVATTDDNDGNRNVSTEKVSAEQVAQLEAKAADVGADIERFCAYIKVDSLADIYAAKFSDAMQALEAKRKPA